MKILALPWIGNKMPQYGAIRIVGLVVAYVACIAQSTSAATSQAGFVSIDCGSAFPYTDGVTGINWVPDTNYTQVGSNVLNVPGSAVWSNNSEVTTLRTFKERNRAKYCYEFPGITPNATYLIRHSYWYGSYDGAATTPTFYVYIDASFAALIDMSGTEGQIYVQQHTYKAVANTISFCLTRDLVTLADPFISALELRPVLSGAYDYDILDTGMLVSVHRNFGGDQVIRYPDDEYDRIWQPIAQMELINTTSLRPITNVASMPQRIPSSVLQTGQTLPTVKQINITWAFTRSVEPVAAILELHFAELNESTSLVRQFTITAEGSAPVVENAVIKMGGPLLAHVVQFPNWSYRGLGSVVTLTPAPAATNAPLINALSLHLKLPLKAAVTYNPDVVAINQVKAALNLTSWNGDPCRPAAHLWLTCSADVSLPRIISVDLDGYNLVGEIPASLSKLTALVSIALNNNKLTGTIPDLSSLTSLRKLYVQNNTLSGPIPSSLGLIPTLQELYLQNNNFSGSIPTSLIRNGLKLDVTGNPSLLNSNDNETLGPLPSPSGTGNSTTTTTTTRVSVIAGAVGGSVAGLFILGCCILMFCFCKKRKPKENAVFEMPFVNGTTPTTTKSSSPRTDGLQQLNTNVPSEMNSVLLDQSVMVCSLREIQSITNNYSRELGKGGFGTVYYGKLPNGMEVAVKVCDGDKHPEGVEFNVEIDVLTRLHHKNLVSLVGYCKENNSQILIYEYLHNGTVTEHLYDTEKAKANPLDWKTRLYIALDAALGLEYLHVGCIPSLIHRDIKSSNILLNERYVAKIADFGLCRIGPADGETHVTATAKGSFGYLDPEYYQTQMLTTKSDVYSFGVFLFELMCARKPIDNFFASKNSCNIADWAKEMMRTGDAKTLVGSFIAKSNPDMSSVWKLAELAMKCVERNPKSRPSMSAVVNELRENIAIVDHKRGNDHSRASLNTEFSIRRSMIKPQVR